MMKNLNYFPIIAVIIFLGWGTVTPAFGQKIKRHHVVVVDTLITNNMGEGQKLQIIFTPGAEHNHPLFAFWVEDMEGNFIQTLYVSESIAKGLFKYGDKSTGHWQEGEVERPAALPYWAHKRHILNEKGNYMPTASQPVVDAYSGATPKGDFVIFTRSDKALSGKFRVMAEINQSWDWNTYWTNNRFPDDRDYISSAQPALVYEVVVDANESGTYEFTPVGRSHHAGKSGELFTDLETLTTALEIAQSIKLILKE